MLANQSHQTKVHQDQIAVMGAKLNEFTEQQRDLIERARAKADSYQGEINCQNDEIRKLGYIIDDKENQLK